MPTYSANVSNASQNYTYTLCLRLLNSTAEQHKMMQMKQVTTTEITIMMMRTKTRIWSIAAEKVCEHSCEMQTSFCAHANQI